MVVVEVAATLVLLVGAGLMIRSFLNLYKLDVGIRTERLMAMQLQLSGEKYQKMEARRAFYERLQPRLAAISGMEGVAITTGVPPFGAWRRPVEFDGRPVPKIDDAPNVSFVQISPEFFRTAGVSIVRGRDFTDADGTPGSEVAIINQKMAAEHFPNEDPLRKRIRFMQPPPPPGPTPAGQTPPAPVWRTIVGISPTIRHSSPQDAEPLS